MCIIIEIYRDKWNKKLNVHFGCFLSTSLKEDMLCKQNSPKSYNWPVQYKTVDVKDSHSHVI